MMTAHGSKKTHCSLLVLGTPKETVYEIARDLCTFFRQESVMINCNSVENFNVRDYLSE